AALYGSIFLHVIMLALLVELARIEHLGWIGFTGLAAVALLLAYEHALVKPSDLSRINAAFFTINGYISVLFFVTWVTDILLHRRI
ncbi:MAG: 4-hydroxybenzoate octaprenyltransferase, partial [Terriglobia bacterium]